MKIVKDAVPQLNITPETSWEDFLVLAREASLDNFDPTNERRLRTFLKFRQGIMEGKPGIDQRMQKWAAMIDGKDPDFWVRRGPVISAITKSTKPPGVKKRLQDLRLKSDVEFR